MTTRARMVDGHILRDGDAMAGTFSLRRLLFVLGLAAALILTNPSNELGEQVDGFVENLLTRLGGTYSGKQKKNSDWDLNRMFDPSISVTNYGIFTVEEKSTKVNVLGLTQSWSCPYFDERMGSFCSSLGMFKIWKRVLWRHIIMV